jgi:hypothetical protein
MRAPHSRSQKAIATMSLCRGGAVPAPDIALLDTQAVRLNRGVQRLDVEAFCGRSTTGRRGRGSRPMNRVDFAPPLRSLMGSIRESRK